MSKHIDRKGNKINKNIFNKRILLIFVLLVCFVTLTATFGRYVINSINNFFLRTQEFYFYSDKLKETKAYYGVENWTGVDDYTITINMNSYENNLKTTSYDIGYNVTYTCSSNAICQLSKNTGNISSLSHSDYFYVTITPNLGLSVGDKVWVDIVATSTTKYTKTLEAQFSLTVGRESMSYEITDNANDKYLDLNITNTLSYYTIGESFLTYNVGDKIDVDNYVMLSDTNKNKCYSQKITLSFDPTIVLLDMTNTYYLNATNVSTQTINGYSYINGITFNIEPIQSAKIRFYKVDSSQNYTYPITNSTSIVTVTSE